MWLNPPVITVARTMHVNPTRLHVHSAATRCAAGEQNIGPLVFLAQYAGSPASGKTPSSCEEGLGKERKRRRLSWGLVEQ
jgi:hypothetical protein